MVKAEANEPERAARSAEGGQLLFQPGTAHPRGGNVRRRAPRRMLAGGEYRRSRARLARGACQRPADDARRDPARPLRRRLVPLRRHRRRRPLRLEQSGPTCRPDEQTSCSRQLTPVCSCSAQILGSVFAARRSRMPLEPVRTTTMRRWRNACWPVSARPLVHRRLWRRAGDGCRSGACARGRCLALHGSGRAGSAEGGLPRRRCSIRRCSRRSAPASSAASPSPMRNGRARRRRRSSRPGQSSTGEKSATAFTDADRGAAGLAICTARPSPARSIFTAGPLRRQRLPPHPPGHRRLRRRAEQYGLSGARGARSGARARHHHQRPADHDPPRIISAAIRSRARHLLRGLRHRRPRRLPGHGRDHRPHRRGDPAQAGAGDRRRLAAIVPAATRRARTSRASIA